VPRCRIRTDALNLLVMLAVAHGAADRVLKFRASS
jgi:hypothetical protein